MCQNSSTVCSKCLLFACHSKWLYKLCVTITSRSNLDSSNRDGAELSTPTSNAAPGPVHGATPLFPTHWDAYVPLPSLGPVMECCDRADKSFSYAVRGFRCKMHCQKVSIRCVRDKQRPDRCQGSFR